MCALAIWRRLVQAVIFVPLGLLIVALLIPWLGHASARKRILNPPASAAPAPAPAPSGNPIPVSSPGAASAAVQEAAVALAKHQAEDMTWVQAAQANVGHAKKNYERVKTGHDAGVVTQLDFDKAQYELALAEGELAKSLSQ